MRALVVETLAPDYGGCVLKEIPTPAPLPGEVRIKVRAASVNFPDLLMTRGEYQHKPPLPFIPGLEQSGEVEALGEGVDRFKIGDAVVGGARIGGFSEFAVTPAAGLRLKPERFSFSEAAASARPTSQPMSPWSAAPRLSRVNGCWCMARPAGWAWRPWTWPRPWACG